MQVEKDTGKILSAKHVYKNLMCAHSLTHGYIHQSGNGYTRDRNQAWTGNKAQFKRLCETFRHDANEFKLFAVWELTAMLRTGNSREH